MKYSEADAIEFYLLTDEARFVLGSTSKEGGYALSGSAIVELENAGFITVDRKDFCKTRLTDKGKRMVPLLAPEDMDHRLQNLKIQARVLRISKVNENDEGNLSIR